MYQHEFLNQFLRIREYRYPEGLIYSHCTILCRRLTVNMWLDVFINFFVKLRVYVAARNECILGTKSRELPCEYIGLCRLKHDR